jgi:hypothetical protein
MPASLHAFALALPASGYRRFAVCVGLILNVKKGKGRALSSKSAEAMILL